MIESVSCDICGSDHTEKLLSFYTFDSEHLFQVKCRNCGLIYINPRPTEESLMHLYGKDFFEKDYAGGENSKSYFENKQDLTRKAERVIDIIKQNVLDGKILDIGCAGGWFLDLARSNGYEPYGVEVSPYMAELAREKLNLQNVFCGYLEQAHFPDCYFSAIHMGDVLEHVSSPTKLLQEAYRILNSGGVLIIDGPTAFNGFYYKITGIIKRIISLVSGREHQLEGNPYHIYEFVPDTLYKLLNKVNFNVRKVITYEEFYKDDNNICLKCIRILSLIVSRVSNLGSRTIVVANKKVVK